MERRGGPVLVATPRRSLMVRLEVRHNRRRARQAGHAPAVTAAPRDQVVMVPAVVADRRAAIPARVRGAAVHLRRWAGGARPVDVPVTFTHVSDSVLI